MAEFRSESPAAAMRTEAQTPQTSRRVYADCRKTPSVMNCSLVLAGTEEEVLKAAYDHTISVHQESPGEALRESIRASLHEVPKNDCSLA